MIFDVRGYNQSEAVVETVCQQNTVGINQYMILHSNNAWFNIRCSIRLTRLYIYIYIYMYTDSQP